LLDALSMHQKNFHKIGPPINAGGSTAVVDLVDFKHAKILQDAGLAGVALEDIARSLASLSGGSALRDFDAGMTGAYLCRAEVLLQQATQYANDRRQKRGS
jgi:hypothetical protein